MSHANSRVYVLSAGDVGYIGVYDSLTPIMQIMRDYPGFALFAQSLPNTSEYLYVLPWSGRPGFAHASTDLATIQAKQAELGEAVYEGDMKYYQQPVNSLLRTAFYQLEEKKNAMMRARARPSLLQFIVPCDVRVAGAD